MFVMGILAEIEYPLCAKGFNIIGNQYYCLFTGLLLHKNWLHLLANAITLYWIGVFLGQQIETTKILSFSVFSGTMTNIVFSMIYPNSTSVGGSPVVFSLIGFVCATQLLCKELPRFRLGTWYGNWIVAYSIVSNIPILWGNMSTIVIHLIAFVVAFMLAYIGLKCYNFFKHR